MLDDTLKSLSHYASEPLTMIPMKMVVDFAGDDDNVLDEYGEEYICVPKNRSTARKLFEKGVSELVLIPGLLFLTTTEAVIKLSVALFAFLTIPLALFQVFVNKTHIKETVPAQLLLGAIDAGKLALLTLSLFVTNLFFKDMLAVYDHFPKWLQLPRKEEEF